MVLKSKQQMKKLLLKKKFYKKYSTKKFFSIKIRKKCKSLQYVNQGASPVPFPMVNKVETPFQTALSKNTGISL